MFNKIRMLIVFGYSAIIFVGISGCTANLNTVERIDTVRTERTSASYMNEGRFWGQKLREAKVTPGNLDEAFIKNFIGQNLDYFNVHEELKEAFKRGFRMGYEDRIADLVLGPHITEAAGRIGERTSTDFVKVIQNFEVGWGGTLNDAVRVFIVLVAEGSQADREYFIQRFDQVYSAKYQSTEKLKSGGGYISLMSEGGTKLYLNVKTTSAFLDIPSPRSLKGEIYRQAFRAMGDEWGKRLSTNLVKRNDLIDLLRRIKAALKEEGEFNQNLNIVNSSFVESYGTDAQEVFTSLLKEAGYAEVSVSNNGNIKKVRK
jgi:hypothetical protein